MRVTLTLMPAAIDLGDRGEPCLGRRDLDEEVRPVDQPPQVGGLGGGGVGVVRQPGGDLEGDPAVAAGALRRPGASRSQASRTSAAVMVRSASSTLDLADGQRVHLVVVGVRAADRRGEDGRVGGHADDGVVVDQRLQVAAADAVAGEVVEPDGDPGAGQLGQLLVLCHVCCLSGTEMGSGRVSGRRWGGGGRRSPRPGRPGRRRRPRRPSRLSRAAATTASCGEAELLVEHGVGGAGAVVGRARRSGRRRRRTRASPSGTPASTLTRARTEGGQHLVLVGLVLVGEPLEARHARPPGSGRRRPRAARGRRRRSAPRSRCPAGSPRGLAVGGVGQHVGAAGDALGGARTSVRSNTGRFCRDSARPAGRSLCSRIVRQATAVSLASAGRTKSRPGMARSAA